MLDVSVVVPFYNPGANIEDCLASLASQTLGPERYEVVLVDDGSSDGSGQRVQRYVDAAPARFRLIRIAASGWPGKPRNVGVDAAQGRYIQFVDSDDSLDPRALERLLQLADDSDADIVVGKLTSDFRGLNHHVFRQTVTGRTVFDYPLVDTLTPHKMVRKALLTDNDIRFAEGPRHVEDEHFSMQLYTRATSVAVVGDLACYFYRRRRVSGRNLGDTEAMAADYFRDLAAVLDVIDDNIADPEARIPLQRRFFRTELLGRLRGKLMHNYTPSYRREVLDGVRQLATSRFAPEVQQGLPFFLRAQSRLVLGDDLDGLTAYSAWLDELRLDATADAMGWRDGRLAVTVDAALYAGDTPLTLERDGTDWLLPASAIPGAGRSDRLITDSDLSAADLDCATISRADSQQWSTTNGLALRISDNGHVTVSGEIELDMTTLQGGRTLAPGVWDLRLRVTFGGLTFGSALRPVAEVVVLPAWLTSTDDDRHVVQPYWTSPNPMLALDVDEWARPATDLLIDAAASISGRDFRIAVPRALGDDSTRPGELLLTAGEATPVTRIPASLTVGPTGGSIHATLPRRLPGTSWQPWIRLGEPGGPPPQRLPWLITKAAGVRPAYSLQQLPNSTPDT